MDRLFLTLILISSLSLSGVCADGSADGSGDSRKELMLIDKALLSVVKITAMIGSDKSIGTGFIVDDTGSVITNYHVVREAESIKIEHLFSRDTVAEKDVEIIATDHVKDIALLKIKRITEYKEMAPLVLDTTEDIKKLNYKPFFVIANSRYAANFLTKGNVGGINSTMSLKLRGDDTDSLSKEYDYELLLFNNIITAGNSGAPIINSNTGEVMALAAGSFGTGDYLAFAVPISYARELIRKGKESKGSSSAAVSKVVSSTAVIDYKWPDLDPDDRYYADIKLVSDSLNDKTIYVNSTVVRPGGDPLVGARVTLSNDLGSYTAYTKDNGFFKLNIPRSTKTAWSLSVDYSSAYKDDDIEMQIPYNGGALEPVRLELADKFKRPVLQFYVEPPVLELNEEAGSISLIGIVRTGTTFISEKVEWELCEVNEPCSGAYVEYKKWLNITNPENSKKLHKGYTGPEGMDIELRFDGDPDFKPGIYAELTFSAKNPLNDNKLNSVVRVYSKTIPKSGFYYIQGFLQLKNGSWSGDDGIEIKAFYKKGQSYERLFSRPSRVSVNKAGYFRLKLPLKWLPEEIQDEKQIIRFQVESKEYRVAENSKGKNYIDYEFYFKRPETHFIEMVPTR